jgi:hypothetical protein
VQLIWRFRNSGRIAHIRGKRKNYPSAIPHGASLPVLGTILDTNEDGFRILLIRKPIIWCGEGDVAHVRTMVGDWDTRRRMRPTDSVDRLRGFHALATLVKQVTNSGLSFLPFSSLAPTCGPLRDLNTRAE